MLSKCANPDCSESFRYLHQGKIFCLVPTPEVEAVTGEFLPQFEERFWLCYECSKTMTVVWGGTQVKLVPLPAQEARTPSAANAEKYVWTRGRPRRSSNISESRGSVNSERQGSNLCQLQN
jgi:hypothetical protein